MGISRKARVRANKAAFRLVLTFVAWKFNEDSVKMRESIRAFRPETSHTRQAPQPLPRI